MFNESKLSDRHSGSYNSLTMRILPKRIRRCAAPMAITLSMLTLSGCVGLEVAHALYQSGNSAVSDLISAERMTIVSNDLGDATPAVYKPYVYRKGQDCRSFAYVLPYDRTWAEEIRQGDDDVHIRPPAPGVIAGYIAVVYKQSCPGKQDEPILRAGRQSTVTGTGSILTRAFSNDRTTYFMNTIDAAIDTRDMLDHDHNERPQWWPQVVGRLVLLAQTDPQVKAALLSNLDQFVEASPENAEALRALEG